jgi:hypothetical protein
MPNAGTTTDERRWVLLRSFYLSFRSFQRLFEQYEARVQGFAKRYDVDRRALKLPPDELHSLIDPGAMTSLLSDELMPLREIVQRMFGGAYVPDPFSSHVMSIYHEVAILKEEHRTIGDPSMNIDRDEYDRYYREVNIYYPRRLRHVRDLYERARKRLEALLPPMGRDKVVLRSLYLYGERIMRDVYSGGIEEFYGHMYPNGGALTAYALVADSLRDAAFWTRAEQAYAQALLVVDARISELDGAPRARRDRDRAALAAQRTALLRKAEQTHTAAVTAGRT